jgi:hypothetical protein
VVHAVNNKITAQNERYERARQEALARRAAPAEYSSGDSGTARGWTRDELYAERTDRWV